MLSLKNAKISYGETVVLEDIGVEIEPGKLTFVIGPNGAGKTTLLNVIAGNKKLAAGHLENTYKKNILIPQRPYYPEAITLYDYVSSVFYQSGWKWSLSPYEKEVTMGIMSRLHIYSKRFSFLNELSAGELQLGNIAIGLISGAELILLDEPAANLDVLNQIMILNILKELTKKCITIVAIMHDINLAAKYGDNFILILKDKKIIYGGKEVILESENLFRTYNVKFSVLTCDESVYIQPDI